MNALADEDADNHPIRARFPDMPADAKSLITFVTDRPGHDQRYAIDATKSFSVLGYKPVESFETGIQKTISWYLGNQDWWQAVMDGSYREWVSSQYQASS